MNIKEFSLQNFRNYETLELKLSDGINVLVGENAAGKTNMLEALHLCGIGRSHRTHNMRELINFSSESSKISVDYVDKYREINNISVFLQDSGKKSIQLNGVSIKKIGELFGSLLIVMFSPEDLSVVKSSPGNRRRFMDIELCQLSAVYYYDLKQYYKALNQRNNLLKTIKQNKNNRDMLFMWDEILVNHGIKIKRKREEFLQKVDTLSHEFYSKITGAKEKLSIKYKANVTEENFKSKLESCMERDISIGSTSFGIHKDDIFFYINGNDLKIYGSQGQQRTAAVCLKLSEVEIVKEQKETTPVLLLDDVLSELDDNRQKWLFESVKDLQTIVTCAERHKALENVADKMFSVYNGKVKEGTEL